MISDKFKNNLLLFFRKMQIDLYLDYINKEYNTKLFGGGDLGKAIELLSLEFNNDYICTGSSGSGFDLINPNTKKIVEVKSCCTIQNSKCQNCNSKFNPLISDKCPFCGSSKIKSFTDSRFSINSAEFIRTYEKNLFDNFTLCWIYLDNFIKEKSELKIKMNWYKINFIDDLVDEKLKYFYNQYNNGSSTCNLLPNSYDFYKLNPDRLCEIIISLNFSNLDIEPYIENINETNLTTKISSNILKKSELPLFQSLKSYDNISETVDNYDFSKFMLYRDKNFGKERGDIRFNQEKILTNLNKNLKKSFDN